MNCAVSRFPPDGVENMDIFVQIYMPLFGQCKQSVYMAEMHRMLHSETCYVVALYAHTCMYLHTPHTSLVCVYVFI